MTSLEKNKAAIVGLIATANDVMASDYTDLTSAVDGLVEGYGQGGDTPLYDGTVIIDEGATSNFTEDYQEGFEAGEVEGIEQGKQIANNEFWDGVTANGTRIDYGYAFRYTGFQYIRPTKKIVPISADSAIQTFAHNQNLKILESSYFDFSQKNQGTGNSNDYYYTFYGCISLEIIEDIGLYLTVANQTFNTTSKSKLHTIEKIYVNENTKFINTFVYMTALVNLGVEGVIGQNGLDLQWSTKLSKASWQSIIAALSSTASGLSMTGSLVSVNTAFETSPGANDGSTSEEWLTLIATKSNWTINLV